MADDTMAPPPGAEDPGSLVKASGKPFDWKKALFGGAALVGGGLLGSKLSGGNLTFGEALGHMAKGAADTAHSKMLETNARNNAQHDMQLKMVYGAIQQMDGIDLAKYPKLAALKDKYAKAMLESSESGAALSPKETTELLGLWTTAQVEMSQAKDQKTQEDAITKAEAEREAQIAHIQKLYSAKPPDSFVGPPTEAQVDPNVARSQAVGDLRNQEMMALPITTPSDMVNTLGPQAMRKDIAARRAQMEDTAAADRRINATISGQRTTQEGADRRAHLRMREESLRNELVQIRATLRTIGANKADLAEARLRLPVIQRELENLRMNEMPGGNDKLKKNPDNPLGLDPQQ